MSWNSLQK
uniref:Uncharacterized protein n=1 Tax=Arundo donax TaxID=35708 RepID=A0A0A8ZQB9_ARUDO